MPDAASRPPDTIVAIVIDAVRHAPPRARRALLLNGAAMLLVVAVSLADLVGGTGALEPYRLAAVIVGMTGISVFAATIVLHHASQQQGEGCARVPFFRLRSEVMDRIFLALPVMAVVATLFLALAVGLFIPAAIDKPLFLVVVVWFVAELGFAVQTVAHTTRFLYEHAERQAAAAAHARAEAGEAKLAALQAQMNPHFLFNTLNTVASLVRTDPRKAERTVENLSDVLRRTLDRSRTTTAPLRDEVEYVRAYLDIEQARWGDRLRVAWAVDPEALPVPVPPMTLQPLVENALKHGIGTRLEGGCVRVAAARSNGRLRIEVTDDGVGIAPRSTERTGLGNLRSRLSTLYGDGCALEIERMSVGTRVVVEVPVSGPET